MSYDESDDLFQVVADFCRHRMTSVADRLELTDGGAEVHSPTLAAEMAENGWLGIGIAPDYGGAGGTLADLLVFLEAAWYGRAPIVAYQTTSIVGAWYGRFGSEAQKNEVLPGIASGRVESLGISEPGAGSDMSAIRLRATRSAEGYVLSGQKTWCSSAHQADHILVVARTSGTGTDGLSAFMVPTSTPGLEVRGIPSLVGRELNEVYFEDCALPASALIGEEGAPGCRRSWA